MKLTDQIHILKHNLPREDGKAELNPGFVYSILLFGDRITLINTGPKGAENLIFDYIAKQDRPVEDIDTLILTQARMEFIGAAPAIKSVTNCTVVAHYEESKQIENLFVSFVNEINTIEPKPLKVNYSIDGNEKFNFGGKLDLDLIYISTNASGSLSVYFPNDKVYFSESNSLSRLGMEAGNGTVELNYLYGKYNLIKEVDILISPFSEPVAGRKNIRRFLSHSGISNDAGTHLSNQELKRAG